MARFRSHRLLGFVLVLVTLLPIYLTTLQTIPNGSEHYYMIDVGETQNVLNRWGTLHATGYPLYVIAGNILVTLMRAVAIAPATAPGLVSLFWGVIALALIYTLALHLTDRPYISAFMTILFGLTRTVWIHNSIAEIYTFGLVFLALLLLIALWRTPIRGRIYWLAFIGGLGVFHHRALLMVAPALLYAVWPKLTANPRRIPKILAISLLVGLLGFLPYLYLPLRANAGAAWVYGEPGTWNGFWDQFLGREAERFIGAPATLDGLIANFNTVNTVLLTDMTAPGIILGLIGPLLALRSRHRRAAITLLLSGAAAYLFHIALYTDILSALILPIILSLVFGWLLLADWLLSTLLTNPTHHIASFRHSALSTQHLVSLLPSTAIFLTTLVLVAALISQNMPFIRSFTTNPTGIQTIALAEKAPPGSVLMMDWGPRFFAAGFAQGVLGDLSDITLVDHKTDFRAIIDSGAELVTPDFTFYNRPVDWWSGQLDAPVYLTAAAPHLVRISTAPELADELPPNPIAPIDSTVECTPSAINLDVAWVSREKPIRDLSVFVHLLDSTGTIVAQADQSAPVYGWRPMTTWEAGEIVRDIYPLPSVPGASSIQYGLYRQTETGVFENEVVYNIPVQCES